MVDLDKKIKYANLKLDLDTVDWTKLHKPFINYRSEDQYEMVLNAIRDIDNLYFTCKYILNIDLVLFQCVLLETLFKYPFPMLIASRGLSKSWILAVYLILRSLILQGHKSIIVGAAFRQSKVIFEYIESIWNNAPVLRDICGDNSGAKRQTDSWVFRLGYSTITALPLGTGDKIRGQRSNCTIADEFQCLTAQGLTETDIGLVRISDFLNSGAVSCINMYGKLELPSKFIITPTEVDVYEIKTQRGYGFQCSAKHKVLTQNGFKLAKNLTIEDKLCLSNQYKFPSKLITKNDLCIDNNLAWLMGIWTSEGAINTKYRLYVKMTDRKCIQKIYKKISILNNNINISCGSVNRYKDKRFKKLCKKSYYLYVNNKNLRDNLSKLGLDCCKAINKKIPWSILQSSREVVISYLSALFEGDGTAFLWCSGKVKNRIGVSYYTSSKQLAEEVHILLLKLGYKSSLGTRQSKLSKNLQYYIRLNSKNAYNFAKELNIKKWSTILNNCCESQYHICDKSRSRINNDWLNVISVKKMDSTETMYDFYLPQTHSFYANGIVQHNSVPELIYEVVVGGFAAVSSNPAESVKREAQLRFMKDLGLDAEHTDMSVVNGVYRGNQAILSGTGDWGFKHFAKYWKKHKSFVNSQGDLDKLKEIFAGKVDTAFNWKDYAIIRVPVELAPPGFLEEKHISKQRAQVKDAVYSQEYGACFVEDSDEFYKMSIIQSCVTNDPIDLPSGKVQFTATLRGNPYKKYILGIDPASESNNFAIVVVEMCEDHQRVVYCWTTDRQRHMAKVKNQSTDETAFYSFAARKIRDLIKVFPCDYIALDSQGGGIGVMEALHDKNALESGELPIWTIMNNLGRDQNPILFPGSKDWGHDDNAGLHMIEMVSMAKSDYVVDANHNMKRDLENKVLLFPFFDPISIAEAFEIDQKSNRTENTLEDCVLEIEELKKELTTIRHTTSQNGRDHWDTPEIVEAGNKKSHLRKDRYCALLMATSLARRIMNYKTPTYNAIPAGGFVNQYVDKKIEGQLYEGSDWFVRNVTNSWGTIIRR